MSEAPESSHAARSVRQILAGLRAVNEAIASAPMDVDDVGDLLRGLLGRVTSLVELPVSAKEDRTGISRESIRIMLERYPQVFGAALVRLRDATGDEELRSVQTDLRRQATALGVTVDSILATSTFRSRSQAATP